MSRCLNRVGLFVLVATFVGTFSLAGHARAADAVRPQAIVDLRFEEDSGEKTSDASSTGEHADEGLLINGPLRVESPFAGQEGLRALYLDASTKQFVQVNDSVDLDRSGGVSLGLFFMNLHEDNDTAMHGVFAKRVGLGDESSTNYGINYVMQSNVLQVYVNHATGFRIVKYAAKDAIGFRQAVHLTATFEVGDAPGKDEDTDADDLRIRLFRDGKPLKPQSADLTEGNDAWLTDVEFAKLLNDEPLTLGCTNSGLEFTSCLIDELTLFPRALSVEEVSQLFAEVSSVTATQLAQRGYSAPPERKPPTITSVSLRGLRAGATTRLTIRGQNLAGRPQLILPLSSIRQSSAQAARPDTAVLDVAVPADTPSGYYPMFVHTDGGLSNRMIVAIDRLPQLTAGGSSADNPAPLPSAFSGVLSGPEPVRIHFRGRTGQRLVAEVEAKRLGAQFEPVLEIKTARGTPLTIVWGHVSLRGDARAEINLPDDGMYFVELHDLAYKAPANSPYRLRIGNIASIDGCFPPGAARGTSATVELFGTGLPAGTTVSTTTLGGPFQTAQVIGAPRRLMTAGPGPMLRLSDARHVIETAQSAEALQTVGATFSDRTHVPVVINGRIVKPGEQDRYVLNVKPEQSLDLSILARGIHSPLDGRLAVLEHPSGNQLAMSVDRPGTRDPGLTYKVPAGVEQIQVAVGDLHERGGSHFLYQLRIIPSGQPDFALNLTTPTLGLPEKGTAVTRLNVNRKGYNGPIRLRVLGDSRVTIAPAEIPAGAGGIWFVTLARSGGDHATGVRQILIAGESTGLDPAIQRVARADVAGREAADAFRDRLVTAFDRPTGLAVEVASLPPALFKGVPTQLPISIVRDGENGSRSVALTLMSTEKSRPIDPKNRNKGNKTLVRSLDSFMVADAKSGDLRVGVPLDVAEPNLRFVVRADAKKYPWSKSIHATAYSEPFRLPVRSAVAAELVAETLTLHSGTENKLRGTLIRTEGFSGSVDVAVNGLPKGYQTAKVTVPADQKDFEIAVTPAAEEKSRDLPQASLVVTATGGGPLLPNKAVTLKIVVEAK